jgi:glycosyltransferase involved in cell wall biosynthesis
VSHIFVYRNCFTGDVSGGDMHTGGVCEWVHDNHPEQPLYLIHAEGDGQEKAYSETAKLQQVTYPDTTASHPALMFVKRAAKGNRVPLPLHETSNIFIAGSHFLPDVWPVIGQGRKAPGAVRVVYIHHIVQEMPRARGLNTMLANMQEQFCFSLIKNEFDAIITVNQQVIDSLRKRGFKQPMLLSSNFVSTPQMKIQPYAKRDITLLFCGRLVPQKGIDDFLAVCEALQPVVQNFKAVMVGAGPEEQRLRAVISKKQLAVEVTGFIPEKKKFELLNRSKLFVLPSIEEGWGIVIAESMSTGTPAVAYDLPVYEVPFGDHLQTVPLKDITQLAKKVTDLLAIYSQDPAAYTTVQQSLIKHADAFKRDTIAANEYRFVMEQTT